MDGKIAIVTGGSKGIGKAIVEILTKNRVKVIIADIDEACGKEVAKINGCGFFKVDISSEVDVGNLIEFVKTKFGKLDILINAAKMFSYKPINELNFSEWERLMGINVNGFFLLIKNSIELLRESEGVILEVASGLGKSIESESSSYMIAQEANFSMIKHIAKQYAPKIRANAIKPGPIATPLLHAAFSGDLNSYANLNPMKRVGTPEEVAELAMFLVSEKSSYVTGSVYSIDGGEGR